MNSYLSRGWCVTMFRCPYCGEEAFSLITKLGIVTKFDTAPRCPNCKKVAFRNFIVGGNLTYNLVLALSAIVVFFIVWLFAKINFSLGIVSAILAYIVFFICFNYYFCYFDKASNKNLYKEILCVQLKEMKNIWPNIRKGEIYQLFPLERKQFLNEDIYTIAKVNNIKNGKIEFGIIKYPQNTDYNINNELVILTKDIQYAAKKL